MKVLMCHNHYQEPGGEDKSFAQEVELLRSKGDCVTTFTRHNDSINEMSRLGVAARTLWNSESYRAVREVIRKVRPAVMHCTNTFPLISPAAYAAAKSEGVAVVQSLRNYRLLCPGAYFMRDGRVCEDCLGSTFPWRSIKYRCYRNSRAGSAVVTLKNGVHRLMGTWRNQVDRYYALTEFSRRKFIEGGLPEEKLCIKPNFLSPDPGLGKGEGDYALFLGRLSPEKGIATLLESWKRLDKAPPLKIVGDGPLRGEVEQGAAENEAITWLGRKNSSEVLELLASARCLVVPSLWYEGFPRTILESFAKGTPVIASCLGSMEEIIEPGRSGEHFTPGDAIELAETVRRCFQSRSILDAMRPHARAEYVNKYGPDRNYEMLMSIYDEAISAAKT